MNIGALNQRIALQAPSATQDAAGQPLPDPWTTVATVWANVLFQNGAQSIKANADTSVSKASLRIRQRAGVAAEMRALWGTTVFDIKAVNPAPRKGFVDLVCEVINVHS